MMVMRGMMIGALAGTMGLAALGVAGWSHGFFRPPPEQPPDLPDAPPDEPTRSPIDPPRKRTIPTEPSSPKTGEQLVKVRALLDAETIHAGDTFRIAYIFDVEPGWHIYWKNPGISGGPTEIDIKAPHGFTVGKTLYPRPRSIKESEGLTYAYENQTVIFVEVTADQSAKNGMAAFPARADWMVCKNVCLLGHAQPRVSAIVSPSKLPSIAPEPGNPPIDALVAKYKSRLPKSLDDLENAEHQFDGKTLTITLPRQDFKEAVFFPIEVPGVTYGEAAVKSDRDLFVITVPVTINPQNALGEQMVVSGLVGLGTRQEDPSYEFEIPLPGS